MRDLKLRKWSAKNQNILVYAIESIFSTSIRCAKSNSLQKTISFKQGPPSLNDDNARYFIDTDSIIASLTLDQRAVLIRRYSALNPTNQAMVDNLLKKFASKDHNTLVKFKSEIDIEAKAKAQGKGSKVLPSLTLL